MIQIIDKNKIIENKIQDLNKLFIETLDLIKDERMSLEEKNNIQTKLFHFESMIQQANLTLDFINNDPGKIILQPRNLYIGRIERAYKYADPFLFGNKAVMLEVVEENVLFLQYDYTVYRDISRDNGTIYNTMATGLGDEIVQNLRNFSFFFPKSDFDESNYRDGVSLKFARQLTNEYTNRKKI